MQNFHQSLRKMLTSLNQKAENSVVKSFKMLKIKSRESLFEFRSGGMKKKVVSPCSNDMNIIELLVC